MKLQTSMNEMGHRNNMADSAGRFRHKTRARQTTHNAAWYEGTAHDDGLLNTAEC